MANESKQKKARPVSISPENYQHMVDVMLELAYRNRQAEELMVRVANAGEIAEVVEEIKKRRTYAKKMGMVRNTGGTVDDDGADHAPPKVRKVGGGRRRSDRKVKRPPSGGGAGSPSHNEGEGAAA